MNAGSDTTATGTDMPEQRQQARRDMVEEVVVVGGGLGGLRACEHLRRKGYEGRITLVGEERESPYSRPPLSKEVLRGERGLVYLRDPATYPELHLDFRPATAATAVEASARRVRLANDSLVSFDALVVATGAEPRRSPHGLGLTGVHCLRTADDCRRLREDLTGARQVVVVGGGVLGCEIAASLRTGGLDVTLVEIAEAPLASLLGAEVGQVLARLHQSRGVNVRCSQSVETLLGEGRVRAVQFSDGTELMADVVIEALGVQPAVAWLEGSGVAVDNGVVCDEYGETTVPGVFALGDVARWSNPRTGRPQRFEHWTSALTQAGVVAHNVLAEPGDRIVDSSVPYFWTDQYDLKLQGVGIASAATYVQLVPLGEGGQIALYGHDRMLTAAVGFGCPDQVMRMRVLIAAGATLSDATSALSHP